MENRFTSKRHYEKRPITPGGCNGCGGDKFDPPQTPQQMENLLREHVQQSEFASSDDVQISQKE